MVFRVFGLQLNISKGFEWVFRLASQSLVYIDLNGFAAIRGFQGSWFTSI